MNPRIIIIEFLFLFGVVVYGDFGLTVYCGFHGVRFFLKALVCAVKLLKGGSGAPLLVRMAFAGKLVVFCLGVFAACRIW